MMAYFLSPALARLRLEVNALWPHRSKASDGWIGDTSHAARKSDHNPDYSAGGIVRAIDVTNDGIDVDAFIASVIRDVRTRYVISRGRIWTREDGWQKYTGPNGHYHHVHVSVRSVSGYDRQAQPWNLAARTGGSVASGGKITTPNLPGAPAPIEEKKKRKADDPMIYRAGGERTPFGIYAHNGGWVELSTKAEYQNLLKAGVPQVWVERKTLDNLIADSRAAGK